MLRVVGAWDWHIPEHCVEAVSVFLKFCKDYKPHCLILGGDFMEMKSVSPWVKDEVDISFLDDEAEKAREILSEINHVTSCDTKYFLVGNHEEWLPQWLSKNKAFYNSRHYKLKNLLELDKFGYTLIPFNDILSIGDANFTHGVYTNQYHSKKTCSAVGGNIYYSHIHESQSYAFTTIKGIKEGMSMMCLRTLNAPFLRNRPTAWVNGFGIWEFREDGRYTVYAPKIIDGSFSFNGKVYET